MILVDVTDRVPLGLWVLKRERESHQHSLFRTWARINSQRGGGVTLCWCLYISVSSILPQLIRVDRSPLGAPSCLCFYNFPYHFYFTLVVEGNSSEHVYCAGSG